MISDWLFQIFCIHLNVDKGKPSIKYSFINLKSPVLDTQATEITHHGTVCQKLHARLA